METGEKPLRILDLFFIFILLIAVCFGGILALSSSSNPTTQTDTFGRSTSESTNRSAELVSTVTITESNYSGWFILFVALAIIIVIMLSFFNSLKTSGLGKGKYRSG